MYIFKTILICLLILVPSEALHSLNNYGDESYPGRCVIDFGTTVVLLNLGESVLLENLPCTLIFCIGDGWGMLETCDYEPAPNDCRYLRYIRIKEEYPKCCKRKLVCD